MLQLVIPAYNEADRLPRTLRDLRRHLTGRVGDLRLPGAIEVIVVDNASTDGTAAVARAADSPAMPVRVVHCARRGKGAAVAAGLAATDAEIVAFADADGATGWEALEEAWRRLALDADVAIGSRALGESLVDARHRRCRDLGARAYRRAARRVVPGVGDTQCGFKVLRGDLARRVAADLVATGFAFDVELLARCRREGARIVELPVRWTDVPGSTFDPGRHGLDAFRELADIRRRMRALPPVAVPALPATPAARVRPARVLTPSFAPMLDPALEGVAP